MGSFAIRVFTGGFNSDTCGEPSLLAGAGLGIPGERNDFDDFSVWAWVDF